VDWSKLDAGLAAALDQVGDADTLEVFVHREGDVRTATVTRRDVDDLSHRPDVRRIALSRRLRLLDGEG
jgi:uncharacterized protein (DUF2336 family)